MKKKAISITLTMLAILMIGCGNKTSNKIESQPVGSITDIRWNLVELMGKPVELKDELAQQPFIYIDSNENRIYGSGGCNNFFGSYELNEEHSRIKFSQVGATLKACGEELMQIESRLFEVIEMADNYNAFDEKFVLNRARMAPLARFEKAKE